MLSKLIVNADDFGLSPGVSEGIIDAYLYGIVNSTTVMMNQEHTQQALLMAKKHASLGVGVHLVFNKGNATLPRNRVPSLLDRSGQFHKNIYPVLSELKGDELFDEFCSQVELFTKMCGRLPTHIDCHHWGILSQTIFLVYLEVAKKYNVAVRNPVPIIDEMFEVQRDLYGQFLPLTSEENRRVISWYLARSSLKYPTKFIPAFFGNGVSVGNLITMLGQVSGVTEIMTHPGYADKLLESSYRESREKELQILTSVEVVEELKSRNIALVNFKDL